MQLPHVFRFCIFWAVIVLFPNYGQSRLLDNFESLAGWKTYTSDGVEISTALVSGKSGRAIQITYNFLNGAGYGGIQKAFPLHLTKNSRFSFYVEGSSPNNNLEFKLLDSSKQNVWWVNKRDFEFPAQWRKMLYGKRDISFAWGPTEDKSLGAIAYLEYTISSYNGGKGTVIIDELELSEVETVPIDAVHPTAYEELASGKMQLPALIIGNTNGAGNSYALQSTEVIIDMTKTVEIGGAIIAWEKPAAGFKVLLSEECSSWDSVYICDSKPAMCSYIRFPETEARYLKLIIQKPTADAVSIKGIKLLPPEYTSQLNRFYINIAKDFPRGWFPRYFSEEASYWSVTGLAKEVKESLINGDGMIELDKGSVSIEPFIFSDGKLIDWNRVRTTQKLEYGYLPIPSVVWNNDSLELEIKTFASGKAFFTTRQNIIYILKNRSRVLKTGNFYAAIRPFQVNPYYQDLNFTGGVSAARHMSFQGNSVLVDTLLIQSITKPDAFGTAAFDAGDIATYLSNNALPTLKEVDDSKKLCSGALQYGFTLQPGEEKTILLSVPYYNSQNEKGEEKLSAADIQQQLKVTEQYWEQKTNSISFTVPPQAKKLVDTYRSMIAYILINADNSGTQPGSRSYERSWIRDGALTCSALLRAGLRQEITDYIKWFSQNLFPNGKVPCVVDRRGPDPVPENDGEGEYLFLLRQYLLFTHDTALIREKYPTVLSVVHYIKSLISERSTDYYKNGNDSLRSLYGLVPESISHEGYSAKPMHSYWDDFFTLRGLNDAAGLAHALGQSSDAQEFRLIASEFETNLYNSINATIKRTGISYIPGCADLGDYDATSTAISLYPCGQKEKLPQPYGKNTFDQYYDYFMKRRDHKIEWVNYTPYEVRLIGTFVQLGERERALDLVNFFMKDQKPVNWNQWAEVVWANDKYPGFIGDMPHTWVGSDYMTSFRMMFLYENEQDSSVVLMAGIPAEWLNTKEGVGVTKAPTYYGQLTYHAYRVSNCLHMKISGDIRVPGGGLVLDLPKTEEIIRKVFINKKIIESGPSGKIRVFQVPSTIEINYK